MTKDRLLKRIAQVGSLPYQQRWVVRADASEYELLDELIETTSYAAKHTATHPALSRGLSAVERHALLRFQEQVDVLYGRIPWDDKNTSNADVVERNKAMQQIRDAANECLRELGVSFTEDELLND